MPEPDLIELFVARFGEIGAHYLVTGSVAATLYGEPRVTHDIDLVVELSTAHCDALPEIFPADEFYLPPPEVIHQETQRENRGHFNIIHHASGLKADVYLIGADELHAWAFRNAPLFRRWGRSPRGAAGVRHHAQAGVLSGRRFAQAPA